MELQALKLYLMTLYGPERVDALFWEIQMIVLKSLLAVQQVMINDKHCFELYGYDVIIDAELKPWLLEVNASPSLSANTREDYLMKTEMLHGMLDVVDMEGVSSPFLPLSGVNLTPISLHPLYIAPKLCLDSLSIA